MGVEPFPGCWFDFIKLREKIHALAAAFFDRPERPFYDFRVRPLEQALERFEDFKIQAMALVKPRLQDVFASSVQGENDYVIGEIGIKNPKYLRLEELIGQGRVFDEAQGLLELWDVSSVEESFKKFFKFPGLVAGETDQPPVTSTDTFHDSLVVSFQIHQSAAAPTQRT